MIFPKDTRAEIHLAEGKPVVIVWPEGQPEPRLRGQYTVQSSYSRAGEMRIEVMRVEEVAPERWEARVRTATEYRPLRMKAHVPAGENPINRSYEPVELEPEQVDADYQRRFSEEAELKLTVQRGRQEAKRRNGQAIEKLHKQRRKGKPGKLAAEAVQRTSRRLKESEAA